MPFHLLYDLAGFKKFATEVHDANKKSKRIIMISEATNKYSVANAGMFV